MKGITLLGFLIGKRKSIVDIASDSKALFTGFLLVISAGLARSYDTRYFPEEWSILLLPFIASIAASLPMYWLIWGVFYHKIVNRPEFISGYCVFLALFWATAPLAWLYGIPYERFLDSYSAVLANLWTLAVVSVWRVLLMARVTSVLFGIGNISAFFLIIIIADALAVTGIHSSPGPIMALMGGISHLPGDALTAELTLFVTIIGVYSSPLWLAGAAIAAWRARPTWYDDGTASEQGSYRNPVVVSGCCVIAFWLLLFPFTQREQRLAWTTNDHLKNNRLGPALELMSKHERFEFPPHFDPRPRFWRHQTTPDILAIMETIVREGAVDWVHEVYSEKLYRGLDTFRRGRSAAFLGDGNAVVCSREAVLRLANILPHLPTGRELAKSIEERLKILVEEPDQLPKSEIVDNQEYEDSLHRLIEVATKDN